ncbi:MAG: hypothetical protein AVDCRST_MAG52-2028, partial [uncultured Blastococcus sp.]
ETEPPWLGRGRLAADPAVLRGRDDRPGPLRRPLLPRGRRHQHAGRVGVRGPPADERLLRRPGGADPRRRRAAAPYAAPRRGTGGSGAARRGGAGGPAGGGLPDRRRLGDARDRRGSVPRRRRAGPDRPRLRGAAALGGPGDDAGPARAARSRRDGLLPDRRDRLPGRGRHGTGGGVPPAARAGPHRCGAVAARPARGRDGLTQPAGGARPGAHGTGGAGPGARRGPGVPRAARAPGDRAGHPAGARRRPRRRRPLGEPRAPTRL